MPGFGKVGISFLICIRLSFALIVQGLAKKYRSEARMIFSANRSKGPPCSIRGKRLPLQVRNRNAEHCLIPRWKTFASQPDISPPIKSGKENLFLKDSLVHMSYIEQYKEALEVRIFPKRTLPVIKRLHPVSFQQSKDVLLLI